LKQSGRKLSGNILGIIQGKVIDISGNWRTNEDGVVEVTFNEFNPSENIEYRSI